MIFGSITMIKMIGTGTQFFAMTAIGSLDMVMPNTKITESY